MNDQADLVSEEPPKEEKEELISAEPGSHSNNDVKIVFISILKFRSSNQSTKVGRI